MHDIITCHEPLSIPQSLKVLNLDWRFEPFKTNISNKFDKYIIYNKQLYKSKNEIYEEIPYTGFLNFYTHFFDEKPATVQYYVSYLAEFNKGKLNYILLSNFKEYNIKKESLKVNYLITIFDLFKKYLKKSSSTLLS